VLPVLLHHVLLSVPQEGLTIKAETCSTLAYKHFPNRAVIDGPIINFFLFRVSQTKDCSLFNDAVRKSEYSYT